MPYFALVNLTNTVTEVLIADVMPTNGTWFETCKNTFCGQNTVTGIALRKNFARVGSTYNSVLDAFIPKPSYASWNLNEQTCTWLPPVDYPKDQKPYKWNEATASWEEIILANPPTV